MEIHDPECCKGCRAAGHGYCCMVGENSPGEEGGDSLAKSSHYLEQKVREKLNRMTAEREGGHTTSHTTSIAFAWLKVRDPIFRVI